MRKKWNSENKRHEKEKGKNNRKETNRRKKQTSDGNEKDIVKRKKQTKYKRIEVKKLKVSWQA